MSKRMIAILLVCLIISGTFSGCLQGIDPNKTGSDVIGEGKKTEDDKQEGKSNFNETGYPIVNEKVTFTCMNLQYSHAGEFQDLLLMKKMEELTNVHMEWQSVSSSDFNTSLSLAFASGNIPDWIYGGPSSYDLLYKYGVEGGALYNIADLIDPYMPNLVSIMKKYKYIKPTLTMEDGSIYGVPYVYDTTTASGKTIYIRTDMLDKVGKKLPTTVDEFYDTLVALRDYGFGDEFVPFEPNGRTQLLNGGAAAFLFPSFGEYVDIGFASNKDNKVVFTYITEQYKRLIEYFTKLYDEGLIEKNVYTMDSASVIAILRANNSAVTTYGTQFDIQSNFESGNYDVELLAPLTSQYSDERKLPADSNGGSVLASINSKIKDVEVLLRWMDVFYTTEDDLGNGLGTLCGYYGIQDYNWEWGNPEKSSVKSFIPDEYSEKAKGMTEEEFRWKFITGDWRMHAVLTPTVTQHPSAGLSCKADQTVKKLWPYMVDYFPNNLLRMTSDEQEKFVELYADIETYVEQQVAKFITGIDSLSNWDKFVGEVEKMGIDEVLKLKQAAYDRYLEINK